MSEYCENCKKLQDRIDELEGARQTVPLDSLVGFLRDNGIDCSEIINGRTIHIFKYDATERELRDLLGEQITKYKLGVYGTINSEHNKGVYHEIEVTDKTND